MQMRKQKMKKKNGVLGSLLNFRVKAILSIVGICFLAAGCAPFPQPSGCAKLSHQVLNAFSFKSTEELVSNVSALAVPQRLDAYVYGMQCLHPPHHFLAKTFVGSEDVMREIFRRMDSDLEDSERFAYLELIRDFHHEKYIDLNSNDDLRRRVGNNLLRYRSENRRAFSIHLFRADGVQF